MLKGIMTGISSATGIYMFSGKYLETFYIGGMQEVLGIEVTVASFFVLMALAGGVTEILQHINKWFRYAYHTAKEKNKPKSKIDNRKESNEHNAKSSEPITTTISGPTVREHTNTNESSIPSNPSIPSRTSNASLPSKPKQI